MVRSGASLTSPTRPGRPRVSSLFRTCIVSFDRGEGQRQQSDRSAGGTAQLVGDLHGTRARRQRTQTRLPPCLYTRKSALVTTRIHTTQRLVDLLAATLEQSVWLFSCVVGSSAFIYRYDIARCSIHFARGRHTIEV